MEPRKPKRMFRDDPAHPINSPDPEVVKAYLHRSDRRNRWQYLTDEQKAAYVAARREKRAVSARAERLPGTDGQGREVQPFHARHSGAGARTWAQRGAVEAYRRGYRVTDAGELRNPAGRRLSTRPRQNGQRLFGLWLAVPEGTPGRSRAGTKLVSVPVATLALYCRYGNEAFARGAAGTYLNGSAAGVGLGNLVLAERGAHNAERGRNARTWTLTGREPIAPPSPIAGIAPARRRYRYEDVCRWRAEWRRNGGDKSMERLAAENGVPLSSMQRILTGKAYRTPEPVALGTRRRRVDDATIRAFRYAVAVQDVPVAEAAARLGRTKAWGYQVMSGRIYPVEARP